MEKGNNNYSPNLSGNFHGVDYSIDLQHQQQQFMKPRSIGETPGDNSNQMIDYMLNNPQPQQTHNIPSGFCGSSSYDKLSFADVMQFADFGPKLALNQSKTSEEDDTGIDPVYFLKFPVLNERLQDESLVATNHQNVEENKETIVGGEEDREDEETRVSESTSVQIRVLGEDHQKSPPTDTKNKRKRPRSTKTSEEVESQRMTHIAVERNRRKQMNEHLRVLRSLMPGSYVQRGDQASIIGGAIEFVRELEQLLQCLESQKRRRLYGDAPRPAAGGGDSASLGPQQSPQPPPLIFPTIVPLGEDQMELIDNELMREETAESKSVLADVEVRALGFDAMIKILCRRRAGQLIKMIAALEDLQLNILHTNITTIEQTVLYSFNVKVNSETRFTAEDIANSVQQILTFIHTNTTI